MELSRNEVSSLKILKDKLELRVQETEDMLRRETQERQLKAAREHESFTKYVKIVKIMVNFCFSLFSSTNTVCSVSDYILNII